MTFKLNVTLSVKTKLKSLFCDLLFSTKILLHKVKNFFEILPLYINIFK